MCVLKEANAGACRLNCYSKCNVLVKTQPLRIDITLVRWSIILRSCSVFIAKTFARPIEIIKISKIRASSEQRIHQCGGIIMVRYFAKRIGIMVVALFMIALLTFVIMHSIPGGPFTSDRKVSPEVAAALNAKYNLDAPLAEQFFDYVGGLLHGDFGPSYKYPGKSVNDFIFNGFPVSAKLGGITIVFVLLAAIPMGVLAAVKNGKWVDMVVMALATIGVTIPSFIIASLLIYIFSFRLNLLPTYGLDTWKGYILPVIALGGYSISYMARLMRSSLLEVMGQDYIRTARAKGLSEVKVVFGHAMRNALIPVITVLGPTIANLMTGSFVIEKIFAIPGLGRYLVDSVSQRDYTTIMGVTIFYATFLMVMIFVVDIFYCLIDPRIKYD